LDKIEDFPAENSLRDDDIQREENIFWQDLGSGCFGRIFIGDVEVMLNCNWYYL